MKRLVMALSTWISLFEHRLNGSTFILGGKS
jgi:hypothetical protein